MKAKNRNSLLLALASFIWGIAFVAQSKGGDLVGAYTFNCIRNLIGATVLIPVMLLFDKIKISNPPKTGKEKKTLILGALSTGTALFVASSFQQIGINMGTAAGKAGFLTACYIVLVPVLGIFIKKKCPMNVWIAVGITLMGLYLLCSKPGEFIGSAFSLADVLLLLCALSFAVQILCVDHFSPITDGVRLASLQFLTCGIISAVPMFLIDMKIGGGVANFSLWLEPLKTSDAWIPILYAGVCSSGIAYTLQVFGQKDLNPTIASLIMSLESVFSVLGGLVLLNERLSVRELIGCAIIFVAVILSQLPEELFRKRK